MMARSQIRAQRPGLTLSATQISLGDMWARAASTEGIRARGLCPDSVPLPCVP